MADTALIRSKIEGQIAQKESELAELRANLAAVEAVEKMAEREYGDLGAVAKPVLPNFFIQSFPVSAEIGGTVADYASAVLKTLGGAAHGKTILEGVLKHKAINSKHQMEALTSAMKRDSRFIKDESQPNYWRLKTA